MKQIIQSLKTGQVEVANIPVPTVTKGQLLIKTSNTLVSTGTERMLVDFGKANWIEKARMQPEKVRAVLDKIKTDGLQPTLETVFNKLNQPLPLGYCNIGRIIELGKGVSGFNIGDRVVSNGAHAEVVSVPINLCAKVPEVVSDEQAAFTVLASVALQSVRLAKPTLGETIVVTGLGLVGIMVVQLLRAQGCRVLGLDFDNEKLELAKHYGAEVVNLANHQDPLNAAELYSRGRGVDAVIIATSTKSNEPIHQATLMCRKRGRIILVGVAGLELSRDEFFKKELTFQVSSSYGPGRHDTNYEEKGQDYPVSYVRWTEQRNFEAVLDMMAEGRLNVNRLISHRFDIDVIDKVYDLISNNVPSLGVLLKYPSGKNFDMQRTIQIKPSSKKATNMLKTKPNVVGISFLGAGNYASLFLIQAFKTSRTYLSIIASSKGLSGLHAAKKFSFEATTTDTNSVFKDSNTGAVVITTQHDSHAKFVKKGLESSKHVFVEKPLCLTLNDLKDIEYLYENVNKSISAPLILMIGFNRRFAPHIKKIKTLLDSTNGPKSFIMTINAGAVPQNHWTQDLEKGGGRIVGEVCHFIDLLRFLASSPIKNWSRFTMDNATDDTVIINLKFEDGSIGTINYFSNGSKSYQKEQIEVFVSGRVLKLENYRILTGFGWPKFKKMRLWRQDKGQKACAHAFINAITNDDISPIPINEILEVSRIVIELAKWK